MNDFDENGIPVIALVIHEDAVAAFDQIVFAACRDRGHDEALFSSVASAGTLAVEQGELAQRGHARVSCEISRGHAELAGAAIYIEGARAEGHGLAEAVEVDKGNKVLKEFAEVQVHEHEAAQILDVPGCLRTVHVLVSEFLEPFFHAVFEHLPGFLHTEGVQGLCGIGCRREGAVSRSGHGGTGGEGSPERSEGVPDFLPVLPGYSLGIRQ